jgi:hypothetical protein
MRLGELSWRGLLEAEYGWRPDGGMSSKRSTAFGLRRALDLIATTSVRVERQARDLKNYYLNFRLQRAMMA